MAQFLRPDSDVTQTSFTGGFAEIDEATASDADFAYGANNTAAVLEVGLSDPAATPDAAGTSTVRYRIAKVNSGTLSGTGNAVTITTAVYQGGTLIQTDTAKTATGTWTAYSFTFTHESITDWTDIRLRFTTSASGGSPSNRRGGAVSWAEIEAPDAAPVAYTLTAGAGSFALGLQAASILIERYLVSSGGAFSLSSNDATISKAVSPTLTADPGTITVTGNGANLYHNVRLTANVREFTVASVGAGLRATRVLQTGTRGFAVSGIDATISKGANRTLSGAVGTFSINRNPATLLVTRKLTAATRPFSIVGKDAAITKPVRLIAATRAFNISGIDANIIYFGGSPTEKALYYQSVVTNPRKTLVTTGAGEDQLVYYAKGFYRIL